jgi:hypothetical protein
MGQRRRLAKLESCRRAGALGGPTGASTILAALLFLAVVTASRASAGDVSAQMTDSLSVIALTTGVLAQPAVEAQPAAEVQPAAATTGEPTESSWQQRFHVTGYLSQVFGMWL